MQSVILLRALLQVTFTGEYSSPYIELTNYYCITVFIVMPTGVFYSVHQRTNCFSLKCLARTSRAPASILASMLIVFYWRHPDVQPASYHSSQLPKRA